MELCREVGVLFEVVLASKREPQQPQQESTEAIVSFTARIENLQTDNAKLTNELNECKDQALRT